MKYNDYTFNLLNIMGNPVDFFFSGQIRPPDMLQNMGFASRFLWPRYYGCCLQAWGRLDESKQFCSLNTKNLGDLGVNNGEKKCFWSRLSKPLTDFFSNSAPPPRRVASISWCWGKSYENLTFITGVREKIIAMFTQAYCIIITMFAQPYCIINAMFTQHYCIMIAMFTQPYCIILAMFTQLYCIILAMFT